MYKIKLARVKQLSETLRFFNDFEAWSRMPIHRARKSDATKQSREITASDDAD
jgi:hypothetical protein